MKAVLKKVAVGVAAATGSVAAFAVGPDMTGLTTAVEFDTVITGVLAVSAAVASVYICIRGAKIILPLIRG